MAKVILNPLGSPLKNPLLDSETLKAAEAILKEKRGEIQQGWGQVYQDRIHQKQKLTAYERIQLLADIHTPIFYLQTFVNEGCLFGLELGEGKTSPSAGVVTALVKVHNRYVVVIANDNTVASGSWWPKTPEKIIRAQQIALKLKLPVVYLVDCSGLFLPEQSHTFPGKQGAGHIFYMNARLSDAGIPQIAGVMGDCIAGGGYMPIISDKVYMTEQAYMVIAGAALIQGAKGQKQSSLEIGGADVHVHESACADERVPDDETCILKIRQDIQKTATSAVPYYQSQASMPPHLASEEIIQILPKDPKTPYDVTQLIARLIDSSLSLELWPHFGQEVFTGIAQISGLYVGILANKQGLFEHPQDISKHRPGGILYEESVAKLSLFSRLCNEDGIPMIWLQDVSGFDVGLEAEKQGLLGYGSSLIYANSTHQTPMITVLLRKASGAGYYAMAGLPYEPVVQLATMATRLSVMEGKTLAKGALATGSNPKAQEAAQKLIHRIEEDMNPLKAASQMDVDEVICLDEMRAYLECLIECCYQSQSQRRIKNPRIWSLHDFNKLTQPQKNTPITPSNASTKEIAPQKVFGKNIITSKLEGTYYLKPSPNDPDFICIGKVIAPGDTIGLIEVMKCFYPIYYEGTKTVTIQNILVQNGQSIKPGDGIIEWV